MVWTKEPLNPRANRAAKSGEKRYIAKHCNFRTKSHEKNQNSHSSEPD